MVLSCKGVLWSQKRVFEVHGTFPQGRFCGVKNAFLEAKCRFPAGAFFSAKKPVFGQNVEKISPAPIADLINK